MTFGGFNIGLIAGYDVLANKISDHRKYVEDSVMFLLQVDVDLIFLVGGATNPDYPALTEAGANYRILEDFLKEQFEILRLKNVSESQLIGFREKNEKITEEIVEASIEEIGKKSLPKLILPVVILPIGNSSTETLEVVYDFLKENRIRINRLVYCSEMARSIGFGMDGLFKNLNRTAQIDFIQYGRRFPDTDKDFETQKKKLFFKLLSHRGFPFGTIRRMYHFVHQRLVAARRRGQERAPRS